jgi:hypothetical protein
MHASQVISALAVVGFAVAKASSTPTQCSQATATVASQADASTLAECTTFTGDVLITEAAAGVITLTGIDQITGSLLVDSAAGLTSLIAPTLNSISEIFNLTGLTILSTLSFPELTSVGSIFWKTLPELDSLTFSSTVNKASVVNIQDTQLTSLDGISLDTVGTLVISNNRMLTDIKLAAVTNVTTSLEIDSNGQGLTVELPLLESSEGDLTFRNATSISIPALSSVVGTLSFLFNSIESISAPNLTTVTGLAINGNPSLGNISFEKLQTIGGGGIQVENNTILTDISGFNSLTKISGALNILGNFTDLSMPKVASVGGAFIAKSSSNFSCTYFDHLHSTDKIFSTTYDCVSSAADVSTDNNTSTTTGTGTSSSASPSSTKKSSAEALNAPIAFGLIGGFLALLL